MGLTRGHRSERQNELWVDNERGERFLPSMFGRERVVSPVLRSRLTPPLSRRSMLFYKIVLGPLLLLQGRRLRKTALRLPEAAGPRHGTVSPHGGKSALRILFVGDSSAAGVGVDHQDAALAAPAAALLSAQLGVPVEWQLVARSGVNTSEALQLLSDSELQPADLVVTALGVNDVTSQRSPLQFVADYEALIDAIVRKVGAQAAIINGVPPLHVAAAMPQPLRWYLGRCAQRLDASLNQWAASKKNFSYISLQWAAVAKDMARDGFHPGKAQYAQWAQMVSAHAATLLAPHASLSQRPHAP
jgi:lysophospholipase L1-like esterase